MGSSGGIAAVGSDLLRHRVVEATGWSPIDVAIEAVLELTRRTELPLANDGPDSEGEANRPSNRDEGNHRSLSNRHGFGRANWGRRRRLSRNRASGTRNDNDSGADRARGCWSPRSWTNGGGRRR